MPIPQRLREVTLLRLIRKGSLCHQRNKRLPNLRTFGPGPSGRWRSATNTSVIWRPNARAIHILKVWIAAKILDITKDEMKLLVKDRTHPVGDIVYRCFSLAFNCKYISFTSAGLNLGRHSYSVNASAIIAATDPNKCDAPLLDWCLRKGHWLSEERRKKCVRAREAQQHLDEEFRRRINRMSIVDRPT